MDIIGDRMNKRKLSAAQEKQLAKFARWCRKNPEKLRKCLIESLQKADENARLMREAQRIPRELLHTPMTI